MDDNTVSTLFSIYYVDSTTYAAGTKNAESLYFISDQGVIYRGEELFTQAVETYTELPTNPVTKRLYINSSTYEGKIYDGSAWITVIKPVDTTVTADSENLVTSKAIVSYVSKAIEEVTGSGTVMTDASYDEENKIITITKGDGSAINLTLNGVAVDLSYDSTTGDLNLVDVSGNTVGTVVHLGLDKFIHSGEYDPDTQNIIFYFDDEKTDSITIPAAGLVDTYTVEGTATLSLTLDSATNTISGSVNISAEADNTLVAKDDGLYVPTTDISGKADKDTDAVEGNIAVFDANGNPIDSGKAFSDIDTSTPLYIGTSIEEAVTGHTPAEGDFCLVKTQIGSTDKYQYTLYRYNGETLTWQALDANYDATNVYFPEDLTTTSAIGNITLTNGQATIAAAGKNIQEVWNTIFVKEKNPTTTQPSVSLSAPNNKAYEVGTTVTPTYTATLNAGSYTYGPATGVTATAWEVTDTTGNTSTESSGSFDAITVEDGTSYKITAKATYGEGATPLTNLGNEYSAGKIVAGTKSTTSAAITGYRQGFYGTTTDKETITSDTIRGLTGTGKAPAAGNTWSVSIPVGAMRVIFAYPVSIEDVSSVLDVNGMNAEIKTAFTMSQMDVEGANGYTSTAYKVYVMEFATANDTANTYKVTL